MLLQTLDLSFTIIIVICVIIHTTEMEATATMAASASPSRFHLVDMGSSGLMSSSLEDDNVSSLGGMDSTTQGSSTEDVFVEEPLRLRFSGTNLVGRKQELLHLKSAWERVSNLEGDQRSEVVTVAGTSGTGKSCLVETLREQVTLQQNGFFVAGKFDQLRNEPLSALVEAFTDLCDLIAQEYSPTEIREQIMEPLSSEYQGLINFVPSLHRLHTISHQEEEEQQQEQQEQRQEQGRDSPNQSAFSETTTAASALDNVADSMSNASGKDMFARFKLSCQLFLRAASSAKHPVLVFLDDMQWADEASIKVIQALLTDSESTNVLIVCTYRSNGTYSPAMLEWLELFTDYQSQGQPKLSQQDHESKSGLEALIPLRSTRVWLNDFDFTTVNLMVSSLLDLSERKTHQLAELILRRTNGNPYFVTQFLASLEAMRLLRFSEDMAVWEWDLDEIQSETRASDNVSELLIQRVETLPERVQNVLRVAACLGFKFDHCVLIQVLEGITASSKSLHKKKNDWSRNIHRALQVGEELGLVEKVASKESVWTFSHDRVHQCLYDMIPETDNARAHLHWRIAKALQALAATSPRRDALVCAIADQLNRAKSVIGVGSKAGPKQCLAAAGANLNAAKLAMSKFAIPVAANYIREGVAMMEKHPDPWGENYSLALETYTTATQVHFCCGQFADCERSSKMVAQHATSFEDGLPARITLMCALGSKGELHEAVDVAFAWSRRLGYDIPKKPGYRHIVTEMIKTKKLLHGKTDEDLLRQTPDEKLSRQIFHLLGQAAEYASLAYKIPHLCVAVLKLTQVAISMSAATPPVYASYGILESVMGNYDEAYRFGQLALKLQEQQANPRMLPPTYPLVYMFFHHWKHPLQDCLEPLRFAYEAGMACGEVDGGFLAIQTYTAVAFHCGVPLEEVEKVHRQYCRQMCLFDHRSQALLALPCWQLCLNLMGLSNHPPTLVGEAIDENLFEKEAEESGNHLAIQNLGLARLILRYCLTDYIGLEQYIRGMKVPMKVGSHFLIYCGMFHYALCILAVNHSRPRRRYRRMARTLTRRLQKNVDVGNINCKPLVTFLKAEMVAQRILRGRSLCAKELFDEAIEEATSQGLLHLQAMANERAGIHLRDKAMASARAASARAGGAHMPDEDVGAPYLLTAFELFEQWGASVKIQQMIVRYPAIFLAGPADARPPVDIPILSASNHTECEPL